jgi:hypothetical protein
MKHGFPTEDRVIKLNKYVLHTTPHFDLDGGCDPYLIIEDVNKNTLYDSRVNIFLLTVRKKLKQFTM